MNREDDQQRTYEAEHALLGQISAVNRAEGIARCARLTQLACRHTALVQRLHDVDEALSQAREQGTPQQALDAQQQAEDFHRAFEQISRTIRDEMYQLVCAQYDNLGRYLSQLNRTWSGCQTIIDELDSR